MYIVIKQGNKIKNVVIFGRSINKRYKLQPAQHHRRGGRGYSVHRNEQFSVVICDKADPKLYKGQAAARERGVVDKVAEDFQG
jgi:hypothetical protein